MDPIGIFLLVILLLFVRAIVAIVLSERNLSAARRDFATHSSVLPRSEAERLVANCNDSSHSTLLEASALIEKDAQGMTVATSKDAFLSQFKQDSVSARVKLVRGILEEFYLPKAIQAQSQQ